MKLFLLICIMYLITEIDICTSMYVYLPNSFYILFSVFILLDIGFWEEKSTLWHFKAYSILEIMSFWQLLHYKYIFYLYIEQKASNRHFQSIYSTQYIYVVSLKYQDKFNIRKHMKITHSYLGDMSPKLWPPPLSIVF